MDAIRFTKTSIVLLVFAMGASAQISEAELRSKIADVHYPVLAEAARGQGDVRIRLRAGVATVLSGPPLRIQRAVESANALSPIAGKNDLDLTYHFVLGGGVKVAITRKTALRGNAFERAVLRILGRQTKRVVVDSECQEGVAAPNQVKLAGTTIEFWIYSKGRCLEPITERWWRNLDEEPHR